MAGLLVIASFLASCGQADPRQRILEERARWKVEPLGWVETEDAIQASVRVSGPVKSTLATLTVTIRLMDPSGEVLEEVWEPLDVSGIQLGTPTELLVRIPKRHPEVDGLTVTVVTDPTPEQARQIPELEREP